MSQSNMVLSQVSIDAIEAYLQKHIQRLRLPGLALAIVEGDRIVHLSGFGRAQPGGGAPTPTTPFFIGSTGKSITALAVMQLVETGRVDLDAPLQHYLPWFRVADPQSSAAITVRHLLNQSSGIPTTPGWADLANFDPRPDAAERQARALSACKLPHPPGSTFQYSNTNYNLLGLVIEAASGESYADYIQEHIFDPLGMTHSYTDPAAASGDGLAVGHQSWFGFPVPILHASVPRGSLPSGQHISCAKDMACYLLVHLNEGRYGEATILSPESIAELHRPAISAPTLGTPGWYAMGWYVEGQGSEKVIAHTGMIPTFYTYMALLPESKRGVVLLVNANHFTGQLTLGEVGAGVTAILAGRQAPPIRFGAIPWAVRSLLLVPLLQLAGVALTLRRFLLWHRDPRSQPNPERILGRHLLLPAALNLLPFGAGLALLRSKLRNFFLLFMPDLSWLALVSGGFSLVWTTLHTRLVLRILRKTSSHNP